SEHLSDTLMPETDSQNRRTGTKFANQIVADSRVVRSSGSRRNTNLLRAQLFNLAKVRLIVPLYHQLRPKLTKILNQVVSKRIVVIDNKDHKNSCARSMARNVALALLTLSSYSKSGSESATTPPPACTKAMSSFKTMLLKAMQESSWPSNPI